MTDSESLHRLLALEREERETPEVVASIREILTRDSAARRDYVRWAYFEGSLGWYLTGDADGHQEVIRRLTAERRHKQRMCLWGATATVVVLALIVGFGSIAFIQSSARYLPVAPVVAWYEPQPDVEHSEIPIKPGSLLRAGDRLQSRAGQCVIRMSQGAIIAWSGLIDVEFRSPEEVFVHGGNLCANVSPQAIGFRVQTPTGTIVDFGTQFGVSVGFDGSTEVHVIQGKVELKTVTEEHCPLVAGEARALTAQGKLGPAQPANENIFSASLLLVNGIRGMSGDLRFWSQPPHSVTVNTARTGNAIGMFQECGKHVLSKPLSVYATKPGTYDSNHPPQLTELPAGMVVRSYFLHAQPDEALNVDAELTFDGQILGFLMSGPQLDATDRTLGLSGISYPSEFPQGDQPFYRAFLITMGGPIQGNPLQGEISNSTGDCITMSPDGRTVRIQMSLLKVSGVPDVDQFRILVADQP